MRRRLMNRFWLWRHRNHPYRDLTTPTWKCACGSWRRRDPKETP